MSVRTETDSFTVNVTGETTGQNFSGVFVIKTQLSFREQLRRDQLRRQLLGADPANAEIRARQAAEALAEITVRTISAPRWWTDAADGLDLKDDAILTAVYDGLIKACATMTDEIKKKGETAKAELRADIAKADLLNAGQ